MIEMGNEAATLVTQKILIRRKEKGERRKEKGERRKEKGERRR